MVVIGFSITELTTMIYDLLLGTIFGSPEILAYMVLLIVFIWTLKGGINTFSIALIGIGALIFYFSTISQTIEGVSTIVFGIGGLPFWISPILIILISFTFALMIAGKIQS